MRQLAGILICLFLWGCDKSDTSGSEEQVVDIGPVCGNGENLLQNPTFSDPEDGSLVPWTINQHAGERSFTLTIEDGIATIERIATQPWFTLVQSPSIEGVRGRELLFRADLRLSLTDENWPDKGMEPGGGLQMLVWGAPVPVLGSTRKVYMSSLEQEPKLGEVDWFTVSHRFPVVADASRVRVGFTQQANGSMSIRNPQLMDCGPLGEGS